MVGMLLMASSLGLGVVADTFGMRSKPALAEPGKQHYHLSAL
jgi:hypothetical protein